MTVPISPLPAATILGYPRIGPDNVGEGSAKPYMVKNKAYQRADSSTVEVDRSELKNLIMEGQHINFESLPAASGPLTFVRLEQELKNKLKISELTQDILKTLQLFSEKEGFNKAAELIADENSFLGIDTARIGESFSEIFDREIFEKTSISGAIRKHDEAVPKILRF